MKISKQTLKTIISEEIKASSEYLKKEDIRQKIQSIIEHEVSTNAVNSQEDLNKLFSTIEMAIRTLKQVPFVAFVNK
jgi:hypothetical protein